MYHEVSVEWFSLSVFVFTRSLARLWAADDDNDNDDGYSRGKCAYTSPVTKGQKERPKVTQVFDGDQT